MEQSFSGACQTGWESLKCLSSSYFTFPSWQTQAAQTSRWSRAWRLLCHWHSLDRAQFGIKLTRVGCFDVEVPLDFLLLLLLLELKQSPRLGEASRINPNPFKQALSRPPLELTRNNWRHAINGFGYIRLASSPTRNEWHTNAAISLSQSNTVIRLAHREIVGRKLIIS